VAHTTLLFVAHTIVPRGAHDSGRSMVAQHEGRAQDKQNIGRLDGPAPA
jgi:hypothetical protein